MLQQTLYAYITTFEAISLSILNTSDPKLLHSFVWGLHDQIKQEICFRDIETIMDAARIIFRLANICFSNAICL